MGANAYKEANRLKPSVRKSGERGHARKKNTRAASSTKQSQESECGGCAIPTNVPVRNKNRMRFNRREWKTKGEFPSVLAEHFDLVEVARQDELDGRVLPRVEAAQ